MLFYSRILILVYLLLPFGTVASPPGNTLKGRVSFPDGASASGAVITIPDLKAGAVTDTSGQYLVENLPKGTYLVQVHMLGFNTITLSLLISGLTTRDFTLSESILEKNEVVVTGTSLATEQRKSTTPIQSVRMKELQESASSNIIDALSRLPGISQISTGPAISKPVIRGLSWNRILTVNDGIRQEGQQWGDEHGIEIDDYNVSKIEVLKGPASLAYGSDALAGVVNIISADPLPAGRVAGNLNVNYQTNNGTAAAHADLGGNVNGFNWNGYITAKTAHDYKNQYDGFVFNSRFSNLDFGASAGLIKKWGYSRLSFTSFSQDLGISEGDRDSASGRFLKPVNEQGNESEEVVSEADGTSYAKAIPRQRILHQKIVWNSSFYLNNGGRLGLTLGYQQNTRKEFADVLEPDEPGLQFQLRTLSYDLKYFFPTVSGWQVTTGINGMQQENENKGIEFLIPDYSLFDAGLYVIARKDIGSWSVSGGLRYDRRSLSADVLYLDSAGIKIPAPEAGSITRFAAFDRTFSNLTGSIGTSYTLSKKTTIKLNIASGYRAPNIAELSANGVHEGTVRYEYGDRELKAENSVQGDLGAEYNSPHIYMNAALFYNYISNFIYIRKLQGTAGNDSIPAENNEGGEPAFIYTQSNSFLYGGEFYMDLHPHPLDWLHFENTFSYVRGKHAGEITDSTGNLPYIPPPRWQTELRVQKNSLGSWLKNGYLKLGVDLNFEQKEIFIAYGTEEATPGYTLLHAGAGFEVVNGKKKTICSVVVSAQNLLDTPYQGHLSRLKYTDVNHVTGRQGIWGMGRNISLLLNIPLQLK